MSEERIEEVAEEVSPVKKKRKASRRLTSAEWGECGALWESGQYTLTMLSERYSIAPESISRKMKQNGYVKGSQVELNQDEVKEAIAGAFTIAADEIAKRLLDTRNKAYNYASHVEKMAAMELQTAIQNKEPIGLRRDNLRALNDAINIFEKTQRQKLISLGVKEGEFDMGDEMQTLSITKMTDDDVSDVVNASREQEINFSGED